MEHSRKFIASGPLRGVVTVPGDKSISHRALMLASLTPGHSKITGLLEGEDVIATAAALRAMGVTIEREQADSAAVVWHVDGVGVGGLLKPQQALDMGNSGTSTRLLMGLLASHNISANFIGDASLSKRPMARVTEPLGRMGATFTCSPGERLPLMVRGACPAIPITYRLPIASAQVKSAILLAGLNTPGVTRVIEPVVTRDHSERMLRSFGAQIEITTEDDGVRAISLHGECQLRPQNFTVPGDPSSAAFLMVAALIVPSSDILIRNVGMNETRIGLFKVLKLMGADIVVENERDVGCEPVADLHVRHSSLVGTDITPEIVPTMVDEFPVLFIAAALAEKRTTMRGLEELRHKESDRLAVMATALRAIGVPVEELDDGLIIEGSGGALLSGGATIETHLDHRIAMSCAVAGLVSKSAVTIDDMRPVATSFPSFLDTLAALGAL